MNGDIVILANFCPYGGELLVEGGKFVPFWFTVVATVRWADEDAA